MIKKLITIACAVVLSLSIVPQGFAEEAIFALEELPQCAKNSKVIGEEIISEDSAFYSARASSQDGKSLYEVLEEGMRAHQEEIDISQFGYAVTNKNKQMILEILSHVIYENYDILSFTGYYPVTSAERIIGVKPMYLFDSYETDVIKRDKMNVIIDGYIEMAEAVPDDVGKLLVIHDAFSAENEYATEELAVFETKNNASELTYDDMVIFTPYGALINNRSVCQGISITLAAIYNKLGIETGFCESDEKNHIWNVVKVDGKWYQLDATWNDSSVTVGTDSQGNKILAEKCFHDYFLVSDALMDDHGSAALWKYYTADGEVSCTDTTYESGHIFHGDYRYGGYNYGGWYGSITHDGGQYIIDVWAKPEYISQNGRVTLKRTNYEYFYSSSLKSNGLIASKPFTYTVTNIITNENGEYSMSVNESTAVRLFATEPIGSKVDCRYAVYKDGKMIGTQKYNTFYPIDSSSAATVHFMKGATGATLFFWRAGTQNPVCEKVDM